MKDFPVSRGNLCDGCCFGNIDLPCIGNDDIVCDNGVQNFIFKKL